MINELMFINMRETGPSMFALREDYTFSCMASYLESKGYKSNMFCGTFKYLSQIDYSNIKPDVIVFSLDFLNEEVLQLVRMYRDLFSKNICVIAGGNFATNHACELLNDYKEFDFILLGEGEPALLSLVEYLNKKVNNLSGVALRQNQKIVLFEEERELELDELPFAKRQVLKQNGLSVAYIASSRGCTRNCSFCSNHVFWKPKRGKLWKSRDVKLLVDEMEVLFNEGVRIFNFVDSSFEDPGVSNERMRTIAKEIINRKIRVGFFVNFRSTVIYDEEFENTLDLLRQAGLLGIFMGVETGNENDKNLYKKNVGTQQSINAYEFFKAKNLSVTCGFINFNPYSTIDNLRLNNELIRKLNLGGYFLFRSKLRVYKGTLLYEQIKKDKLLLSNKYYSYDFIFKDEKIGMISATLEKFLTDSKNKSMIDNCRYFCKYYKQNLKIMAYIAPEFMEEISNAEKELDEFIEERSKINCDMFDKLLDYAAKVDVFSMDEAMKIVTDINQEKLKKQLEKLKKQQLFLQKNIMRKDG